MKSGVLVERTNIGIFGRTNAGKSTLMNLLTGHETSIVDEKAGTTADTVQTVMELHNLGPVKLFDTAGLDELSKLGGKKKFKALQKLRECDAVVLVIGAAERARTRDYSVENEVSVACRQYGKEMLAVYNVFSGQQDSVSVEAAIAECERSIFNASRAEKIAVDFKSAGAAEKLIRFLEENCPARETRKREILPFVYPGAFVALNIPVDEETPESRLLRPQNAVMDFLLRRGAPFAGYKMDLLKARSGVESVREQEKNKWLCFLEGLEKSRNGLQLVMTDSQAIDVVAEWTPERFPLTTFSIAMVNFQSRSGLAPFVEGLKKLDEIKTGDRIAVAEACNHNRMCDDIGTVQIPRRMKERLGFEPEFEFIFGRDFPSFEKLKKYALLVHCGGCMVDSQKIGSREEMLEEAGVPFTNYGLLLSYLDGAKTLKRVLEPWGVDCGWIH
ncbi:50S ribosome-binding GTPase [Candidatus Micrarchaeota archaeon]|nr:50S ribosome-binding GTPase [Candidatus Micrarchaeota archaeon]